MAAGGDQDVAALRARVERLEAENTRLRAAATRGTGPGAPGTAPVREVDRPPRTGRGRGAGVVALVVVAALLAPLAVLAVWARDLVTDTDRYLQTVAPVADDPAVQQAVTQRVTTALVDGLQVERLAGDLTSAVVDLGLPPRAAAAVESLQGPLVDAVTARVRTTVRDVVASDEFGALWASANRAAHEQLVAVLRGDPDALARLDADGTLSVRLGPVVEVARDALVERGFTVASRVPALDPSFPLVTSADLVTLRSAYRVLDVLGTWLPWLVVALLAGGVLTARRRSRTIVAAGLALSGAMLLLGAGLAVGRQAYLGALPATVQRPDAAAAVYDHAVALLRVSVRAGLVLGLVLAAAAYLAGGSASARATRDGVGSAARWLRDTGERRGVTTGPVGGWLGRQRTLVRVVVAAAAALALVAPAHLTGANVLTVAVAALVVLLVVELVARAPAPEPDAPTAGP